VELTQLLNAGAIAGLISNAIASLGAMVYAQLRPSSETQRTTERQLLLLLAHLSVGACLGFIFWLSWGFTALVGITWWQRGAVFALLTWALCCVPLVSAHVSLRERQGSTTALLALQWLTTFVFAGLSCAWTWAHRS
jgi:hypothetical protein